MTAFIIGPADEEQLKSTVKLALDNPIPWEVLKAGVNTEIQETDRLTLDDKKGLPPIKRPVYNVILPLGWRVAISCEDQPAGRLLHLSMSSPKRGKIPSEHALLMVIKACGYTLEDVARMWLEEFDPGHNAVNVLFLRKS
jgi:hypothetical protein